MLFQQVADQIDTSDRCGHRRHVRGTENRLAVGNFAGISSENALGGVRFGVGSGIEQFISVWGRIGSPLG
ncbi:hypothetical protein [Baaleninema simplex]|uniref:hypothetical protein n=1 Tax=Baaleninema simplex TaxID=2862350 RepID=UPI000349B3F5|nr:hypothetical protein [Baaleninema simplex]